MSELVDKQVNVQKGSLKKLPGFTQNSRKPTINVAGDSPVWYQLLPSFPPALYMATIIDRGWFGRCAGLIGW